jgi:Reverse transcriptase (RNA-dependent DNA polymerase)
LKSLIHREESRKNFAAIRKVFKPQHGKGIISIDIPDIDNPGKMKTITEPVEMVTKITNRNIGHFAQADGSPFTKQELIDIFGYTGTTQASEALIQQQEIPQGILSQPESVMHIINQLGSGKIKDINKEVTYEEFVQGIKNWKESTTTSPSGRHLGHYKVLLSVNVYDVNQPNVNISSRIMDVYYQMVIATANIGQSLDRWCKIATCMIEKQVGVSRLDKLRVIHLYEADYNLMLKIIWARKIVWNASNLNVLNEGQAGSRPGKRAINVVVQKEMKYLFARLTRTPLGTIDNDAKSCYDRIICNLAMMVSRYYGVPLNYCEMQGNTLKNSVFNIRTGLGDATQTYQHSKETPIHGTGQGSCASPAIWLLISSFLMDLLQKNANGMRMYNIVDNEEDLIQYIEGFVDDTSLFTNLQFGQKDLHELIRRMEEDGTIWSNLLEASGGKLEMEKCFYYLISWKFNKNGSPCPQISTEQFEETITMTLEKHKPNPQILQKREVDVSHKTLGTFKSMTGNEDAQIKYLTDKCLQHTRRAKFGQLSRTQARTAYYSTFIPSMMYSTPATCLDEYQLNTIQQPATTQFLRIQGYDMHFPRAVVYGPQQFGGLGFQLLYVETSCRRIEIFICEWNSESKLGKSMRININWVQLHCGISIPLMEYKGDLNYIPKNWFTVIRDFFVQVNAELNIRGIWLPKLLRDGDIVIMDEVNKLVILPSKKEIVNNWRLYFGINTLSQMTNYNGDKIMDRYLKKKDVLHTEVKSVTPIKWPVQEMPCIKTLPIWRNTIEIISGCDKDGNLGHKKLGKWFPNHHNDILIYSLIHYTRDHIITRFHNQWKLHQKINNLYNTYYYTIDAEILDQIAIEKYFPIDVEYREKDIACYTKKFRTINIEHLNNSSVLQTGQMRQLDNAMRLTSLLTNSILNNEWQSILGNGANEIIMCSDGGAKDNVGTFGMVANYNGQQLLQNKNRIPLVHNDANSHRSEAFGMLSALCTYNLTRIYALNKNIEITTNIRIVCDNAALVNTVNKYRKLGRNTKYYYSADNDVITEILDTLKLLTLHSCSIKIIHVKGHQDRQQGTRTEEECLNIQADKLATEARGMKKVKDFDMPGTKVTLRLNKLKVVSKHTQTLR